MKNRTTNFLVWSIAGYHYLLQIGVAPALPCSAVGYSVSCSQRFVLQYGYITIPMMALSAFGLITLLMVTVKNMRELIQQFDLHIISRLQKLEVSLARIAIFIVYFWFGLLKLLGVSPATPLVQALFEKTINFMPFSVFYTFFSVFEIAIGVLFLLRGLERLAIFLLSIHLITTILPLIFLPHIAWQTFLVPTLEGQYIIKNVLIAASAVVVGSKLVPIAKSRSARGLS